MTFDHCARIERESGVASTEDDLHCHTFIAGDTDIHSPGEGCYEKSREVSGVYASCHDDLTGGADGMFGE